LFFQRSGQGLRGFFFPASKYKFTRQKKEQKTSLENQNRSGGRGDLAARRSPRTAQSAS
jgi:hypothetical protein